MRRIHTLIHTAHAINDRLTLPFARRARSRQRVILDNGEEAALVLPQGTVLRDGQLLQSDDGLIIEVRAAHESLYEVRGKDPMSLVRAAYHLGNRHVALAIGEGFVRLEQDYVLKAMLERMGLLVNAIDAPFEPEAGAYGATHGGHPHGGDAPHPHSADSPPTTHGDTHS